VFLIIVIPDSIPIFMFVYLSDIHKTGIMMLTKMFVLLEVRMFKIIVIKLIIIYFYLV
jgi:hypothetical protein